MKKILFPTLLLAFCVLVTAAFTEVAVRLVADDPVLDRKSVV